MSQTADRFSFNEKKKQTRREIGARVAPRRQYFKTRFYALFFRQFPWNEIRYFAASLNPAKVHTARGANDGAISVNVPNANELETVSSCVRTFIAYLIESALLHGLWKSFEPKMGTFNTAPYDDVIYNIILTDLRGRNQIGWRL